MQNEEKVTLENTQVIDLPPIDITPYIGKRVKIAVFEEYKNQYGYGVRLITETVGTVGKIELKARRSFFLKIDAKNIIGWVRGDPLDLFLIKLGVSHYRDAVGREVICQTEANKKTGKVYLAFVPAPAKKPEELGPAV